MFLATLPSPDYKVHAAQYNDSNRLPPNFKEITEKEFASSQFFIYSPRLWEYRQINVKEDYEKVTWPLAWSGGSPHRPFDLRMAFFHDGRGVAIAQDSQERVRYFSFALCEHLSKTRQNIGNCLNRYTCDACGYVEEIDSSD